jgi:hypothetical protein
MTNLTHISTFDVFISILYVFRATPCSSSGESIVSVQHLVCVTLCRWAPSVQVGKELPDLQTRRSEWHIPDVVLIQWFSWWWARGCSKHVENWNKHIGKELCVKFVFTIMSYVFLCSETPCSFNVRSTAIIVINLRQLYVHYTKSALGAARFLL